MDLFFSDLLLFWLIFSSDILKHLHWDFKKGNHFSFLLFFYHLLRYFFFLLIFCLMHIFLWYLHFFFRSTFLLVRDLLDLGFSLRFIPLLNGFFALRFFFRCILFDLFFLLRSTFLLVDVLLWEPWATWRIQKR